METLQIQPIRRLTFEAHELVTSHPPKWSNPNKRALYQYACPAGYRHQGRLSFTRWRAMELPQELGAFRASLTVHGGYYDYISPPDSSATEWYVNFADPCLFAFYAGGLFAQDEMQVAEHPVLASLREALVASGSDAVTVENDVPTPVLIMGAERRCSIATAPDAAAGRSRGLYGNEFSRASAETVRQAAALIEPPTFTNLIAMAAEQGGPGPYTEQEIRYVLTTAYTGFSAACLESRTTERPETEVVVHSGFWGCGAFGGNPVIMTVLQLLAAHMSGVNRLILHSPNRAGSATMETAVRLLEEDMASAPSVTEVLRRIHARGLRWGTSNGT